MEQKNYRVLLTQKQYVKLLLLMFSHVATAQYILFKKARHRLNFPINVYLA